MSKRSEICAIIEEGCKFEGNLSFSGVVRIAGVVNGSVFSNDTLIISEGAVINADINANVVIISGSVKGNVKASSRVEIRRRRIQEKSVGIHARSEQHTNGGGRRHRVAVTIND